MHTWYANLANKASTVSHPQNRNRHRQSITPFPSPISPPHLRSAHRLASPTLPSLSHKPNQVLTRLHPRPPTNSSTFHKPCARDKRSLRIIMGTLEGLQRGVIKEFGGEGGSCTIMLKGVGHPWLLRYYQISPG